MKLIEQIRLTMRKEGETMNDDCLKNKNQRVEKNKRTFCGLGTVNQIEIDSDNTLAMDLAISRIAQLELLLSPFLPQSDIYRINEAAGLKPTKIKKETMKLLKESVGLSNKFMGTFDINVRPLVELWKIKKGNRAIPTQNQIKQARELVNVSDLILDETNQTVFLKRAGQALDLGGIAKGYAADEAKRVLEGKGITSALINLGGNIVALGKNTEKEQWKIGIQNPLKPTGIHFGVLHVNDCTVVTSGSNEQFFIKDGRRYHHIINPKTGEPAESGLLSVTVVAQSSLLADALATAMFVAGLEAGYELAKLYEIEAIFVTEGADVIVTNGLQNRFEWINP